MVSATHAKASELSARSIWDIARTETLRYAGKVGTGFTFKSSRDLAERFAGMAVEKPLLSREETAGLSAAEWRSIHWIKPTLICEVAFTEWTQDNRIRHPSFQGLREDKDAGDVKKETATHTAKSSAIGPGRQQSGYACGERGHHYARRSRHLRCGPHHQRRTCRILRGRGGLHPSASCSPAPQPAALPLRDRRRVLFSTQSRQGPRSRREDVRLHATKARNTSTCTSRMKTGCWK